MAGLDVSVLTLITLASLGHFSLREKEGMALLS